MPLPNYYNPYMSAYPVGYNTGYTMYNAPMQVQPVMQQPSQQMPYMISVDGEAAAKSWQSPIAPQPNSIIPLFDLDGQHVYFKSFDAYGRMNPIRKGTIVFEDEVQKSETAAPINMPDMSSYVTKDDLNAMKEEIMGTFRNLGNTNKNNQNGNNYQGGGKR